MELVVPIVLAAIGIILFVIAPIRRKPPRHATEGQATPAGLDSRLDSRSDVSVPA
jgi:hypothetical protein